MYQKMIRNDIRKNKLTTVIITGFIMFAALFTSLGTSLVVNLFSAIDNLMADARAPHYFQMHSGDIDKDRLNIFAAAYKDAQELQITEFLNFDGAEIIIGNQSLTDSIQDNGLSTQNKKMDFLLDLDNQIIYPNDGEIYVPVYYKKEGIAKIGDVVSIKNTSFTVVGFLRDSQMNAAMSSSKRFLVSDNEYEQLRSAGKLEYLIEFRFSEGADLVEFEAAYIEAGLEDNGPAGSHALIRLMNGITDGILIAMLLLVSLLILIVAFLCVRFTLIAKMEEEYREIGVLKAIGLRVSEIKKLYLAKYSAAAAIGCGLGFLLSLVLQKPMLANIRLFMGRSGKEAAGVLAGGCGAIVIFIIVMLYVMGVLRRFKKISSVQAIRYGAPTGKGKLSRGFSLSRNRLLSTSAFLGMKDVFVRSSLYLVMLFVLVISCFIMIVPQNIKNTISDRSFMTYMGIGECDLRLDIHLADDIPQKTKEIAQVLSLDTDIKAYSVITCRLFDMPMPDGSTGKLRVELGDHSAFPLTYAKGRAPVQETDIALSTLNGKELEKDVGDLISLKIEGQERNFTVCGLYSDVTNGGMTAKASFQAGGERVLWSKIPVRLSNPSNIDTKITEYKEQFPYAKVAKIDDYLEQSFGSTKDVTAVISAAAILISAFLMVLITLLFIKMMVMKDRYQISVLKALGFTSMTIRRQYIVRAGVVLLFSVVIGTIAANTLGALVGTALMSSFGVTEFRFRIHSLFAYLITPVVMTGCVYIAARLGSSDVKTIKISAYIRE